jgi:hypothetical protein
VENTNVSCPICFALPEEPCISKYVVYGEGNVIPVLTPTHGARIADSERARSYLSRKAPQ